MPRLLVTAFEPYGRWKSNSSWMVLTEFTKNLPQQPKIVTRRYPVDYAAVREKLTADLKQGFDYALHLGQYPGAARIHLEAFGVNAATQPDDLLSPAAALAEDGPAAYRSHLPLDRWGNLLRERGIPAVVSHHAGTYLCNGTMYLSHYLAERMKLSTRIAFIHLPLASPQTLELREDLPSLPLSQMVDALRLMIGDLAEPPPLV